MAEPRKVHYRSTRINLDGYYASSCAAQWSWPLSTNVNEVTCKACLQFLARQTAGALRGSRE